jgi:molecular chaperone DnaK
VSRIESAIGTLREATKGDDLEAIRRASDELQKASHAIAEQLYKQQASGPSPKASEENADIKDGEVVDA